MKNLQEIILTVDNLVLDPNNPRFNKHAADLVSSDQAEEIQGETLSKMLAKEQNFEIEELANNIRLNGFLGFDRLFVKKISEDSSKYLVVEGNRRLAAVQYLLHKSSENPRKYGISGEVMTTFQKIPCIDLTNWSDEETERLLGLRHYDSVKDWRPLPASFNLFRTYMMEYCKNHDCGDLRIEDDGYEDSFIYDAETAKRIAGIYSMKELKVRRLLLTYRIYLQIIKYLDSLGYTSNTDNIFSLITETIAKPILQQRFGFDSRTGTFSDEGLELFVDLCFGSDGLPPVITEVARGESTLRDYAYVLQKGSDHDRERIEVQREKAEAVKAHLKSREFDLNLPNALKQIRALLGKINLEQINPEEISDGEKEIVDQLQAILNRLRGAAGGKF